VTGGHAMDRPGYFFEPTILADITDGTRIVDESSSVRPCRSSLTETSTTHWSGRTAPTSGSRARCGARTPSGRPRWLRARVRDRVVNTHLALAPQQPFGGFKWSGVGVENGPWGLSEFTEIQALYRSRAADGLNVTTAGLVS